MYLVHHNNHEGGIQPPLNPNQRNIMSIIYERGNHGLTLYKQPHYPELVDELLEYAEANEPEPEEELSF